MVHLVDYYQGNYLFRGNEPVVNNDTFAYTELTETMKKIIEAQNSEFPTNFELIDMNFLNLFTEEQVLDTKIEEDWYSKHSQSQNFFKWPIFGSITDPDMYSEDKRKEKALTFDNWDTDRLTPRLKIVYDLLHKVDTLPKMIYFHCEHGIDRTGEFGASYVMLHFGWDYGKAIWWDTNIANRLIHIEYQQHAHWYCYYLKYKLGMDISCEIGSKADLLN
ncbi:phosphatase [Anaeramoeba flamelloides]|uniref:Phosphatase n=1 Tax=Anaeramoeba flamelloides TaxID=1746091 RepID=A0AAV7Y7G4_9EUKA|nr:phosphatase [Anaeramoeba flamelloides]KAJ6241469.1 phosphatase [Anaeramoeba flamelloides]